MAEAEFWDELMVVSHVCVQFLALATPLLLRQLAGKLGL
jgi:hypothetical protein